MADGNDETKPDVTKAVAAGSDLTHGSAQAYNALMSEVSAAQRAFGNDTAGFNKYGQAVADGLKQSGNLEEMAERFASHDLQHDDPFQLAHTDGRHLRQNDLNPVFGTDPLEKAFLTSLRDNYTDLQSRAGTTAWGHTRDQFSAKDLDHVLASRQADRDGQDRSVLAQQRAAQEQQKFANTTGRLFANDGNPNNSLFGVLDSVKDGKHDGNISKGDLERYQKEYADRAGHVPPDFGFNRENLALVRTLEREWDGPLGLALRGTSTEQRPGRQGGTEQVANRYINLDAASLAMNTPKEQIFAKYAPAGAAPGRLANVDAAGAPPDGPAPLPAVDAAAGPPPIPRAADGGALPPATMPTDQGAAPPNDAAAPPAGPPDGIPPASVRDAAPPPPAASSDAVPPPAAASSDAAPPPAGAPVPSAGYDANYGPQGAPGAGPGAAPGGDAPAAPAPAAAPAARPGADAPAAPAGRHRAAAVPDIEHAPALTMPEIKPGDDINKIAADFQKAAIAHFTADAVYTVKPGQGWDRIARDTMRKSGEDTSNEGKTEAFSNAIAKMNGLSGRLDKSHVLQPGEQVQVRDAAWIKAQVDAAMQALSQKVTDAAKAGAAPTPPGAAGTDLFSPARSGEGDVTDPNARPAAAPAGDAPAAPAAPAAAPAGDAPAAPAAPAAAPAGDAPAAPAAPAAAPAGDAPAAPAAPAATPAGDAPAAPAAPAATPAGDAPAAPAATPASTPKPVAALDSAAPPAPTADAAVDPNAAAIQAQAQADADAARRKAAQGATPPAVASSDVPDIYSTNPAG